MRIEEESDAYAAQYPTTAEIPTVARLTAAS